MNEELDLVRKHIKEAKKIDVNYVYSYKISRVNKKILVSEGYNFQKLPFINRVTGGLSYYIISW